MNWFKIGDVVQVSKIDHQFFIYTWYKFYRRYKPDLRQYGHSGLDSTSGFEFPCNMQFFMNNKLTKNLFYLFLTVSVQDPIVPPPPP